MSLLANVHLATPAPSVKRISMNVHLVSVRTIIPAWIELTTISVSAYLAGQVKTAQVTLTSARLTNARMGPPVSMESTLTAVPVLLGKSIYSLKYLFRTFNNIRGSFKLYARLTF